jgi:hypothetical protein
MKAYIRSRYSAKTSPERRLNCIFSVAIAKYARSIGYDAYSPLANAPWWEDETPKQRAAEMDSCLKKIDSYNGDFVFITPDWQETSRGMIEELRHSPETRIIYVSYKDIESFMDKEWR